MVSQFDEKRFLALRRASEEALQLSIRARELLARRDLASFDGLGHLLDAVLPDEPARLEQLASLLDLSVTHLQRLRASRLDPLSLPVSQATLLGYLAGLVPDQFEALVLQDHERFARVAEGVTARESNAEVDERLAELRAAWRRLSADDASEL